MSSSGSNTCAKRPGFSDPQNVSRNMGERDHHTQNEISRNIYYYELRLCSRKATSSSKSYSSLFLVLLFAESRTLQLRSCCIHTQTFHRLPLPNKSLHIMDGWTLTCKLRPSKIPLFPNNRFLGEFSANYHLFGIIHEQPPS